MVISCDPPRHALLIHFSKRDSTPKPTVLNLMDKIEIALERQSKPKLNAIHFIRHQFTLPFVDSSGFNINEAILNVTMKGNKFIMKFNYDISNFEEVEIFNGLIIMLKLNKETKPILGGFSIDKNKLDLEIDTSEIEIMIGTDNLKDVGVLLFRR